MVLPKALDLARRILATDAEASLPLLREAGFKDARAASRILDRLVGPPVSITPLPPGLLAAVMESGWPDRALRHLERFVEVTGARASFYGRLETAPPMRDGLMRLLAFSRFLTDVLVRNPELLSWLFEDTAFLARPLGREGLRGELLQALSGVPDTHLPDALRRFHRRELLRIGAAEVLGCKDVDQVGRELADLADVTVQISLDVVTRRLRSRYGRPLSRRGRPALFSVVALGKYGGRELNFSSDIDLLFVFDEEGQTRRGDRSAGVANAIFFDRLAEGLIQILTEVTAEGFLYRVDMRLRPEGDRGPLTRSLRSYWVYYETRGELWERQMLLKARRAAGSLRLWQRFRSMLGPFVRTTHATTSPREAIRRVKERIEAEIRDRPGGGNNIKLQPGGIRDIEFIVQCLQLLRVEHRWGEGAAGGTLAAMARLRQAGLLRDAEADTLSRAYRFLRRVENLLQIDSGRPAYAVPTAGTPEAEILARVLQLGTTPPSAAVASHCREVREIYESLFYGESDPVAAPGSGSGRTMGWLLEAPSGSGSAADYLQELGFRTGADAHGVLLELGGHPMLTAAGRTHLEDLLNALLPQLAAAPDPDAGLVRFACIVDAYGAAGAFYSMALSHPRFLTMLATVCGSSGLLSELLQHDPGLLDLLTGLDPEGGLPPLDRAARRDHRALKRYRDAAVLRIGADDLLGLTASEETFHRLSDLADTVLGVVLEGAAAQLARRRGRPRTRTGRRAVFVCIAGGKCGGRELDFASDLDLFFVYEGEGRTGRGIENGPFFAELARRIIARLQDGLFDVDARLRPEGRSAPMVVNLSGYRRYLKTRGATWERLALSRARVVAGDAELGRRVLRAIAGFVFRPAADEVLLDEIVAMRRRMEPPPGRVQSTAIDIKRGPGGLVDVEFIAQTLVLCHGGPNRRLHDTSTRVVLERMVEAGHLERHQGRRLLWAYERLRQLQKALRLAGQRSGQVLPDPGPDLEVLARAVGAPDGHRLVGEVADLCAATRADFEAVMTRLRARVAG